MAFEIFLIDDNGDYTPLDTEGIDMTTSFAVADLSDISVRKGTQTKTVTFKGTKTNDYAFGTLFHLNRYANTTGLTNKLFFNYTPLRPVTCIVYEDSRVVLKGSIRVMEIDVEKKLYHTVITDKLIDFKSAIAEKKLTDLSFADLRHRYTWDNIANSWWTITERYDPATNTYSTVPFNYGNGYVYPFIDYGITYRQDTALYSSDYSKHQVLNFRPAIYAKEYFTRIFQDAGFTYKLNGDAQMQDKFSRLIVPNADDRLAGTHYGFYSKFQKSIIVIENQTALTPYHTFVGAVLNKSTLLNLNSFTPPPATEVTPYIKLRSGSPKVLEVQRNFKSDAKAVVHLDVFNNYNNQPFTMVFIVVERNARADDAADEFAGWEMSGLASKAITIGAGASVTNQTITLNVAEKEWSIGRQVAIMAFVSTTDADYSGTFDYSITDAYMNFPKDEFTQFVVDIELGSGSTADAMTPTAPVNIKQSDFIKSVMAKMNLYAYVDPDNERNIIFESYDDYYALTSPLYLSSVALDWSKKVDFPSTKWKASLTIPKTYLFTDKEDNDRCNSDYKKKFNEVYGTFSATDSLGVVESKKVETVFSASPVAEYSGTNRPLLALYEEAAPKKPIKTNIRLIYYNGMSDCVAYDVIKDAYTSSGWSTSAVVTGSTLYPKATPYYFDNTGKPIEDLHFGRPKQFYFTLNTDYINADSAYATYYINQVTELTNPNLHVLEVNMRLTELDIANLDLKTPIFLDLNPYMGYGYFKILEVEYVPKKLSKVTLQRILTGIER